MFIIFDDRILEFFSKTTSPAAFGRFVLIDKDFLFQRDVTALLSTADNNGEI
jgi:hypothetical protein